MYRKIPSQLPFFHELICLAFHLCKPEQRKRHTSCDRTNSHLQEISEHKTSEEKRDQPCKQVCGRNLSIWEVYKCMNNPPIASKTEGEEPIDCKPASFGDRNHVWLLELQQPCKPRNQNWEKYPSKSIISIGLNASQNPVNRSNFLWTEKGKWILTEHWRVLHLLPRPSENPYKKTSLPNNT